MQLALASWLVLAPVLAASPPESADASADADLSKAKKLFDEGTARYEAADYEGAIDLFTLALSELRGQGVDDFGIRGLLLFNIGRTHMRAFEIDDEREHLKQAKSIFTRFVEEAAQYPDQVDPADVEEAKTRLAEIDRLLAEPATTATEPTNEPSSASDRPARDPDKLRASGIGLTVAGAALLGGGVGMLVWGAGYGPAAEQEIAGLDDAGLPMDSPAFADADAYLEQERGKGTAWMAAGGVTAAVGVVGLAFGVRQLIQAKKLRASVTPTAAFGRDGGWVGVVGRF